MTFAPGKFFDLHLANSWPLEFLGWATIFTIYERNSFPPSLLSCRCMLLLAKDSSTIDVLLQLTLGVSKLRFCCLATPDDLFAMDMGSSTDFQPSLQNLVSLVFSLSDWLNLFVSQVYGFSVTLMDSVVQKSDRSTFSLNLTCTTVVVTLFSRPVDEPNVTHPSSDFLPTTCSTCLVWPMCMYA